MAASPASEPPSQGDARPAWTCLRCAGPMMTIRRGGTGRRAQAAKAVAATPAEKAIPACGETTIFGSMPAAGPAAAKAGISAARGASGSAG